MMGFMISSIFRWKKKKEGSVSFNQVSLHFSSKKQNYRDEMKSVSYDYAQEPT